ncbi:copper transporter [Antribacter gilvus]|uniref:copper transporter n=1 Tax=Antribacter gilvus TaxID=2304675 RepID=UPI0013E08DFC|nr:copper transporter [Antribacter gilvus]
MIDFRYHLVSLISVFLALAVGIILGAGPLQGSIGELAEEQVDQLRDERNAYRDQLESAQEQLDEDDRFVEAAGGQLLAGRLEGQRVAVLELGEVSDEVHDGVVDQIVAAGGEVVADGSLTEVWYSPDEASMRRTLAAGFRETFGDGVPDGTTPPLAAALAIALTGGTDGTRSEEAIDLENQLEQLKFLEVGAEQTEGADAVVLLAAPLREPEPAAETTEEDAETPTSVWTSVAATLQDRGVSVVLAGPAEVATDVVTAVRADEAIARKVTTVSGVARSVGRITVPLAVAATLGGVSGHFGLEDGGTALPPVVELPADGQTPPAGDAG